MSFYRAVYATTSEEQAYIQHHLSFASHSNVMDLARANRVREMNDTSSIDGQGSSKGMYRELSPVYGDQCTNASVTQQASFESDDRYPAEQAYRSFAYTEANNPSSHTYSSSSPHLFAGQDDLRSMRGGSSVTMSTSYQNNQMPQNDLPTIANHPDLRWITTSSTDMRTQSPMNMSSPRPLLPIYPTQPSTPNRSLHPQGSMEEGSSSAATITHSQLPPPPSYPSSSSQSPRVLRRTNSNKKAANPNVPTKPKGTPGRKRKFQDHELTPAEATKRHIRRERNKVAAAKCRNRRRELTDRLQGETDHLEDHQNMLHHEIISLQQEKEHLEFILAAHSPNCKAGAMLADASVLLQDEARVLRDEGMLLAPPEAISDINTHSDSNFYFRQQQLVGPQVPVLPTQQSDIHYESTSSQQMRSINLATDLSSRGQAANNCSSMAETRLTMTLDDLSTLGDAPLNTPVCTLATPSQNNDTFTFPSTPSLSHATTDVSFSFTNPSDYNQSTSRTNAMSPYAASMQVSLNRLGNSHESCSAAQRRSSSSESHQSPDSVKSPKLLAL